MLTWDWMIVFPNALKYIKQMDHQSLAILKFYKIAPFLYNHRHSIDYLQGTKRNKKYGITWLAWLVFYQKISIYA